MRRGGRCCLGRRYVYLGFFLGEGKRGGEAWFLGVGVEDFEY